MSKKVKFKGAEDLSIRQPIFQISDTPVAEHLNMRNKSMNLNNVKYFSLDHEIIKELAEDENGENLIVNGEFKIPFGSNLKRKPTQILIDEEEAVVMVIAEIVKEQRRALELMGIAEKIVDGLDGNLKIYEERAKQLGITITIEDKDNGQVVAEMDGENIELQVTEETTE